MTPGKAESLSRRLRAPFYTLFLGDLIVAEHVGRFRERPRPSTSLPLRSWISRPIPRLTHGPGRSKRTVCWTYALEIVVIPDNVSRGRFCCFQTRGEKNATQELLGVHGLRNGTELSGISELRAVVFRRDRDILPRRETDFLRSQDS